MIYGFIIAIDATNSPTPKKKNSRSARVPNGRSFIFCSRTAYVIFIQNSSIFSVTRKVYLQKNVGESDQQSRGTNYQQSAVDGATERKACLAWQ